MTADAIGKGENGTSDDGNYAKNGKRATPSNRCAGISASPGNGNRRTPNRTIYSSAHPAATCHERLVPALQDDSAGK